MKKLYILIYVFHLCKEGGERVERGRREGGGREEEIGGISTIAYIVHSLLLAVLQLAIPNSTPSLSPFSTRPLVSH